MLSFFPSGQAKADSLHITPDFELTSLGRHTDVLFDASGRLTVSDVSSERYSSEFFRHDASNFNFGMTKSVIWLRFKLAGLQNGAKLPEVVLAVDKPDFPYVDLYVPLAKGGKPEYQLIRYGLYVHSRHNIIRYRHPVFELPSDVSSLRYCYLRIVPATAHKHVASIFRAYVGFKKEFMREAWLEIVFFGLLLGVLASMILYNSLLVFFLRSRAYLLYVIYVFFNFTYVFLKTGIDELLGFTRLDHGLMYSIVLSYIFGILFSQRFLSTKKYLPVLHKLLWGLVTIACLVVVLYWAGLPRISNTTMYVLGLLGPVTVIAAGFLRLHQGLSSAKYYLVAWIVLLGGASLYSLAGLGLLPSDLLTLNALVVGMALEAVLLSTAMGERIRVLRQEKWQLEKQERRLTELSITDELTGLYNRRWFTSRLSAELAHSRNLTLPLSLLVLDVDHFKQINDTHGHAAGDKVLAELGRQILRSIRATDIACRYGGEEFAVIMPGGDLAEAIDVANRLRRSFASLPIGIGSKTKFHATVSIGVAELRDDDDEERLFQRADEALYRAKQSGRNRVMKS